MRDDGCGRLHARFHRYPSGTAIRGSGGPGFGRCRRHGRRARPRKEAQLECHLAVLRTQTPVSRWTRRPQQADQQDKMANQGHDPCRDPAHRHDKALGLHSLPSHQRTPFGATRQAVVRCRSTSVRCVCYRRHAVHHRPPLRRVPEPCFRRAEALPTSLATPSPFHASCAAIRVEARHRLGGNGHSDTANGTASFRQSSGEVGASLARHLCHEAEAVHPRAWEGTAPPASMHHQDRREWLDERSDARPAPAHYAWQTCGSTCTPP